MILLRSNVYLVTLYTVGLKYLKKSILDNTLKLLESLGTSVKYLNFRAKNQRNLSSSSDLKISKIFEFSRQKWPKKLSNSSDLKISKIFEFSRQKWPKKFLKFKWYKNQLNVWIFAPKMTKLAL